MPEAMDHPAAKVQEDEPSPALLKLDIVSDPICPWCFILKRRLERVLAALEGEVTTTVRWQPFELNPDMPAEGMERRAYRSRKFGSWAYSQKLDAQVQAVGAREGLDFRFDRITRTPNTFLAHRLIWQGERAGRQDAVVEAIFHAYFTAGEDIADPAVLQALGERAGLSDVAAFLAGDAGGAQVRTARGQGAGGVPSVRHGGTELFTGAIDAGAIAARLRRAVGRGAGD